MTPRTANKTAPAKVAETPEQLAELFVERLAAGDLDGLVELYEPAAVFAPNPALEVGGSATIRERLAGYVEAGARITLDARRIVMAEDIALISTHARVVGFGAEPLVTTTTEVARRQADGRWLYAIDHPFFGH
ncbi:nuclear transport factor 2 family protein [Nocardia sp. NPDC049707]|uniref:YybH family protein n=1 Tax=Nocardia sp. NPDC049707 TaxID=3154735 RepID=UPI003435B2A0